MEKLVTVGLLGPGVKDNVYEELLEKIDKNKLSANILTVTIVNALSKLVYVAKSKKDKFEKKLHLVFLIFLI